MAEADSTRVNLLLQQLEQLPTLPMVAVRVLELTSDNRATARQLVGLIESDPSLTARILRVCHRSDGGLRSEINSIERAVVFLGFEAVRNAALAVGVFETFGPSVVDRDAPAKRFSREQFWKHCIAVACAAELIAEAMKQDPPGRPAMGFDCSDAFVAGLLHDIGKVAVDAALPKSFARVVEAVEMLRCDIADVERTVIGLDHNVVGKRLAERWMFPAVLRDVIWLHGQLPQALPQNLKAPQLVNVVTLADAVVRQQHIGYSGNYAFPVPVPALLEALKLSQKNFDEAMTRLVPRIEPRARSLGLGEATSEDLYRQALVQANSELSRVTDQLAARNRKLAVRAKFFEALSQFHDELRPDAPPATVLQAIAQTAGGVLGTEHAAGFSLAAPLCEAMVTTKAGEVVQRSVIDLQTRATPDLIPAAAGDGPLYPVGPELEWLTQHIAPRLGGPMMFWIPLRSDNQVIGGVVWGAAPDEPTRLGSQFAELAALAGGWSLALRTCQIREESRRLNEQLAEANRRLTSAQDEIMRARMLASVGEMAAGAAHEMNNPLAVISGRSQLLALQLQDPRHKEWSGLIAEQSQRISDIISELMDFARPSPPALAACEVASLLQTALIEAKSKSELASRKIEITACELPLILADPQQVSAAIAEVMLNAIQATDDRDGVIEVSTAFDRYGSQVVLSITDNGSGMDERTLIRAFDPFYSARPAGRRRGMGLAKALRWVEASGGSIRIESRAGTGSRVLITLPVASAQPQSPSPRALRTSA